MCKELRKFSLSAISDQILIFSFHNQKWEERSTLLYSREGHAIAPVDLPSGKFIYIFGGEIFAEDLDFSNKVERYDIQNDTFTEVSSMNLPRRKHCAVTVGEKIFILGGQIEGHKNR